jgi:mono/diheme cytochrome c family protein
VKPGEAWDPVKDGKPVEYIKVQTIFTNPAPGAKVAPGRIVLRGKAFSGAGAIEKVEISTDSGKSWQVAKLSAAKDPDLNSAWQEFEFEVDVARGKTVEAWARATDARGNTQPVEQEWNPKGYLYNAVDRVRFTGDAAGSVLAEGQALVAVHCQTCHSLGIAEGQRLSKGEWVKTVKKMSDYGLVLADEDAEKIAGYFAEEYPVGMPVADTPPVELASDPSSFAAPGGAASSVVRTGNSTRGGKLFATHCAACHGIGGGGNVGPVLRGRSLTEATFWSTVWNGKRAMPAFKEALKPSQIGDIRAWLGGKTGNAEKTGKRS